MRRAELFATLPLLLAAALWACNKPSADTNPPDDTAMGEPGPGGEPATENAEPAETTDPAAEQKAAEEKAAAEAAEKKGQADAQIAKGQELYGANCASCHGAAGEGKKGKGPAVVGAGALPLDPGKKAKLRKGVQFNTAKDVADFVVKHMPPKKGGSLPPEDYLAILAFDLSANGIAVNEPLTMENAASIQLPRPEAAPAADAGAAPAEAPAAKK
jgi:mono/diheme cytochrome c family protein